jgi:broad specificity phosphatase PhoE
MGPTFYLARHGERLDFVDTKWTETAANPHDAPLTALGEEQAIELGQRLTADSANISCVVASPFSRTMMTAVRAASELRPIRPTVGVEPGASEWLNKEWYGNRAPLWRSVHSLASQHPNVNSKYVPIFPMTSNKDRYPETQEDVLARAKKTIAGLLETHGNKDGNILIVGHGSSVEAFYKVCGKLN